MPSAHFEDNRIIVTGNTFYIKNFLKSCGYKWDPDLGAWVLHHIDFNQTDKLLDDLRKIDVSTAGLKSIFKKIEKAIPTIKQIQDKYDEAMAHQAEAVVNTLRSPFYLIGSEPGTGKTYMALILADILIKQNSIRYMIVVCPSSIKGQWQEEINRWVKLKSLVINGAREQRVELYERAYSYDIMIVNYELLQRDMETILPLAKNALIIFDEASKFKNYKTKTYKASKQIRKAAYSCIAMTGTPIENSLQEFWNIISLLRPDLITWHDFHQDYTVGEEVHLKSGNKFRKVLGYKNIDKFVQKISPYYIRHKKKDVRGNLPNMIESKRFIDQDPLQSQLEAEILSIAYGEYSDYTDEARYFASLDELKKRNIFSVLTLLRLVSDDPRLLLSSESKVAEAICKAIKIPMTFDSPKIEELETVLAEHYGSKVVIFTQFSRMAQILNDGFKDSLVVTGSVDEDVKTKRLNQFKKRKKYPILITTDTMAYGYSLDEADVLVNFDIPWAVGKLIQRTERIHRISSMNDKYIYHFISNGAEMQVWDVLRSKITLFKEAVEGTSITNEALRDLLIKKLKPKDHHFSISRLVETFGGKLCEVRNLSE